MIGCTVISDRGDLYLPGCLESLQAAGFTAQVADVVVVDDREHHLGLSGAVRKAWGIALERGWDYLFHVEEDFRFPEPVNLADLVYILERAPHLAQVVLKRNPAVPEMVAGGIVEQHPDDYTDCHSMRVSVRWAEHNRTFSLNPCVIPRRILELDWPEGGDEAAFTRRCQDLGYRFAFYGNRFDPPRVLHIGDVRAAGWRL